MTAIFANASAADAPTLPAPTPPAPPMQNEEISITAWGRAHPACREWTNQCQSCVRNGQGEPQCSLIGIACQPQDIICRPTATPTP